MQSNSNPSPQKYVSFFLCLGLSIFLIASVGCAGHLAQIMYIIKGNKIPADYKGLEGKKVAVVCVTDASSYGGDDLSMQVCRGVSLKLAQNVKKIEVIPPYKVEELIDRNGFDGSDFTMIGDELGADVVLAIELRSYSLHEGGTMYKGRSELTATVFDITKSGQVDYVIGPKQYSFPENGRPATQTNERQFELIYLAKLTEFVSRNFYAFEKADTIAEDATYLY